MRSAMAEIDFESEGLLEGVEGRAREARLKLLRELADEGVPLDELRVAVEEHRLALLPVERILSGATSATPRPRSPSALGSTANSSSGSWQALGMALSADDAEIYSDA